MALPPSTPIRVCASELFTAAAFVKFSICSKTSLSSGGSVDVPEETLKKCASIYYALKEIIEEYSLHMVTVKCIGESLL